MTQERLNDLAMIALESDLLEKIDYIWKKSTPPPTYEGWNTSPPNLSKWIFYPLNFLKQDKSPPEVVLKNHSKSQKNHKIENPIVLDSK
jgi:hypothetical protein